MSPREYWQHWIDALRVERAVTRESTRKHSLSVAISYAECLQRGDKSIIRRVLQAHGGT